MAATIGISLCQVAVSSSRRAARSIIGSSIACRENAHCGSALPAAESRCYHRLQSRRTIRPGEIMLQLQSKLALCSLPAALLAVGSAFAQGQQQNFSAVEIKTHQVAGNLHYLEGQGGNVGVLIGDDGVLMI